MSVCAPVLDNIHQHGLLGAQATALIGYITESVTVDPKVKSTCTACVNDVIQQSKQYNGPEPFRQLALGYYKCFYGTEYGSKNVGNPIPCAPTLDNTLQQVEFPVKILEFIGPLLNNAHSDVNFKTACHSCLKPFTDMILQNATATNSETFRQASAGYYKCMYGQEYGSKPSPTPPDSTSSTTPAESTSSTPPTWVYVVSSVGGTVGVLLLALLIYRLSRPKWTNAMAGRHGTVPRKSRRCMDLRNHHCSRSYLAGFVFDVREREREMSYSQTYPRTGDAAEVLVFRKRINGSIWTVLSYCTPTNVKWEAYPINCARIFTRFYWFS